VIDRRTFLAATGTVLLTPPLAAEAQRAGNLPRIGFLAGGFAATWTPGGSLSDFLTELRGGLEELGYVDGQNVAFEYRFAEGRVDRLPELASELVRLKVRVIVAVGPTVLKAARDATTAVPIVAIDLETDPVAAGFAATLARPGGNITGSFLDQAELRGKWLELLKEVVPRVARVAVLWDAATPSDQLNAIQAASKKLELKVQTLAVHGPDDFEGAFAAAAKDQAKGMVMLSSPLLLSHAPRLTALTVTRHLPTIAPFKELARAGCLMAYGPSQPKMFRRLGSYAGRILQGAKPAELPIERPSTFELVINLKTAKALGLTIPPSLLGRADEVIQ